MCIPLQAVIAELGREMSQGHRKVQLSVQLAYLQVGQNDARHGLRRLPPALAVIHIQCDLRMLRRLVWVINACTGTKRFLLV